MKNVVTSVAKTVLIQLGSTLFRMDPFGVLTDGEGTKKSSFLKSISHINDRIWHSYSLPIEDLKNISIT